MEHLVPTVTQFDDVDTRPISLEDFYVEGDYATRGVTIGLSDGHDGYHGMASYGDFYVESDFAVTRGVTLNIEDSVVGNVVASDEKLFSTCALDASSKDLGKLEVPTGQTWLTGAGDAAKDDMLFLWDDIAPELTQDIREHLSLTTVKLVNASPPTIANKLISLLKDTVDAQIDKVNKKKFTIRAQVYLSDAWCTTKARIYRDNHDCVVEFQRRSGNTFAFNRMFQVAKAYLQNSVMDLVTERIAPPLDGSVPADALAPLLDMIEHCSGDRDLLAEAASSLAVAARNPQLVAQLRTPCALSALQQLQQVPDFRVAYPTGQILACIS